MYPATVNTVADQLAAKALTWRGYMEGMASNCEHPATGSFDQTQTATAQSQYAARHNPFVYFHSLIDSGQCAANDVPLDRLSTDLASAATTPNLAFITPDLCHDAHDSPCADGGPGGLPAANDFLETWVPRIVGSPAWGEGSHYSLLRSIEDIFGLAQLGFAAKSDLQAFGPDVYNAAP